MDAIEAVGPVVRGFAPMPDDLEQFLRNVGKAAIGGVSPTYAVRREVFEDLISTGNLRLLRDPEIRTAIRSYYRSYDIRFQRTVERLTGYPEFVLGILPTELRDDLDQAAMATFNIDRAIEMIMSDQFETLLNREHNLAIFMEWSDADFLASAREFLHNLEQHISQLEGARS
jgi:hypothetical protein